MSIATPSSAHPHRRLHTEMRTLHTLEQGTATTDVASQILQTTELLRMQQHRSAKDVILQTQGSDLGIVHVGSPKNGIPTERLTEIIRHNLSIVGSREQPLTLAHGRLDDASVENMDTIYAPWVMFQQASAARVKYRQVLTPDEPIDPFDARAGYRNPTESTVDGIRLLKERQNRRALVLAQRHALEAAGLHVEEDDVTNTPGAENVQSYYVLSKRPEAVRLEEGKHHAFTFNHLQLPFAESELFSAAKDHGYAIRQQQGFSLGKKAWGRFMHLERLTDDEGEIAAYCFRFRHLFKGNLKMLGVWDSEQPV